MYLKKVNVSLNIELLTNNVSVAVPWKFCIKGKESNQNSWKYNIRFAIIKYFTEAYNIIQR